MNKLNQERIAKFEKVSTKQFCEDAKNLLEDYDYYYYERSLRLVNIPKRSTQNSAGYDFYSPISFKLKPGQSIKIPTGIRCYMHPFAWLGLYPRSSCGIKYNIELLNTVGVIDSDYYKANNEGHIILGLKNTSKRSIFPWRNKQRTWVVNAGERICQGIFHYYGITFSDEESTERTGGIGSSGK